MLRSGDPHDGPVRARLDIARTQPQSSHGGRRLTLQHSQHAADDTRLGAGTKLRAFLKLGRDGFEEPLSIAFPLWTPETK